MIKELKPKEEQSLQPRVDISTTTPIISPDGNHVFAPGVILRKVSKFLTGNEVDSIIPIQCFYDIKTGKILTDMLPKELQKEYEQLNETK